ncbi:hypothetical protein L0156_10320 [bacterium]|nr:hypothetical protein [bacterium]
MANFELRAQNETDYQSRARRAINRMLRVLHERAHHTRETEQKLSQAQEKLRDLTNANPQWVGHDFMTSVQHLIKGALIIFVFVIDFFLFNATAEWLAQRAFHDLPQMVWVGRILVPMFILGLEIFIAVQIHLTRQSGTNGWLALWISTAVVLNALMPVIVFATETAARTGYEGTGMLESLDWMTKGLIVLATVSHAAILFGGGAAYEGMSFCVFRMRHRAARSSVDSLVEGSQRRSNATVYQFQDYWEARNEFNNAFPQAQHAAGPFDQITRDIINRAYGYEVIATVPAQPPASPQPAEPALVNPGNGHDPNASAEEAEYLRQVLRGRVQDEEDEVKP